MAFRRSPRAIRDKALQEPYQSWIDRSMPLPASVRLLPRTVNVWFDLLMFLMLGSMFGGMAALIAFLPPWLAAGTPWGMLVCLGVIVSALLLVPLALLRRLYRTAHAAWDQKRGVLRQGILVGPEGLLVRIEPNQCYPTAADRFVDAKIRVSGSEGDDTVVKHLFRIETRDGAIEFFNERLADTPETLNRAVRSMGRALQ